jgi:hypothetical protein
MLAPVDKVVPARQGPPGDLNRRGLNGRTRAGEEPSRRPAATSLRWVCVSIGDPP